jgi:hypothetical protein
VNDQTKKARLTSKGRFTEAVLTPEVDEGRISDTGTAALPLYARFDGLSVERLSSISSARASQLTFDNLGASAHDAAAEAVSMEIEQEIAVLSARMRFAQEYSAAKGWNFADLKVEQMLEIRDQEGWRIPALPSANA